jgi:hypothetical protein
MPHCIIIMLPIIAFAVGSWSTMAKRRRMSRWLWQGHPGRWPIGPYSQRAFIVTRCSGIDASRQHAKPKTKCWALRIKGGLSFLTQERGLAVNDRGRKRLLRAALVGASGFVSVLTPKLSLPLCFSDVAEVFR